MAAKGVARVHCSTRATRHPSNACPDIMMPPCRPAAGQQGVIQPTDDDPRVATAYCTASGNVSGALACAAATHALQRAF